MNTWVSTPQGRHLGGRKRRDTAPEVQLRRLLHARGLRFRVDVRLAKGCRPDIVLPRWNAVIFVDGCFWHGCPRHGRRTAWSGPNAALWEEKMRANAARDIAATEAAERLGWRVLRIWECEVGPNAEQVADWITARRTNDVR